MTVSEERVREIVREELQKLSPTPAERRYSTEDLATEFGVTSRTIRKRATTLGIGGHAPGHHARAPQEEAHLMTACAFR